MIIKYNNFFLKIVIYKNGTHTLKKYQHLAKIGMNEYLGRMEIGS